MTPARDGSGRRLLWAALGRLVMVVLTHIAERMHWFPSMGWGQPDSLGHYLDLFSAIAGLAFLLGAVVFRLRSK